MVRRRLDSSQQTRLGPLDVARVRRMGTLHVAGGECVDHLAVLAVRYREAAALHQALGTEQMHLLHEAQVLREQHLVAGRLHERAMEFQVQDRKSVVEGKSVSVRVDLGGCRNIQKNNKENAI